MKNLNRAIWGAILVVAAVIIALNSFGVINFNLFFDGWWTLFIIVPSFVGIIKDKKKGGAVFGLCIGILLLLCSQDIITWDMLGKIIFPLIVAIIGFKMIFSSFKKNKKFKIDDTIKKIKFNENDLQRSVAVFCGAELDFNGVVFEGADLITVFGGIDCDLRKAIIEKDTAIKVVCIFGGVDIIVPDNVRVVNNIPTLFGGVDVINRNNSYEHTIYVDGVCIFGGVDIK